MGKKYFITGVSQGLGRELSRALLSDGNMVYGISRHEPDLKEPKFIWKKCDVADHDEIEAVIEHQGSIGFIPDVVILNAGTHMKETSELVFDDYMKIFRVNSEGSLRWIEAYLPLFKKKDTGHFVYISSFSAILPFPYRGAYSSSKAYVSTAFSCLRRQYTGSGILFTTIYPGLLDTEMSAHVKIPQFFKYSLIKASKKILRTVSKRKAVSVFPLRNLILEVFLYFMPNKLLLRLLSHG